MLKFDYNGKSILISVKSVTESGVVISIDGADMLLDFDQYPWFKNAPVSKIFMVEKIGNDGLCWDDLDIDISLDSLFKPELYTLKSSSFMYR